MNNIFIIIEGPDNVGKSTLINGIKQYFNDYTFHTLHYGSVKQETNSKVIEYSKKMYNEMFTIMKNEITNKKSGIICDRSHLGEMVYGPIYRGYDGEYVLEIEKKYHHIFDVWNNLILITLIDEPENLISREDGLSFSIDLEKKKNEIDNFVKANIKSTIKYKLLLNIKNYNEEQTKLVVLNFIKGKK